ncbi:MAG: hypothetical protein QMC67_04790 [Candidatus Wallbacteria bacterium]
MMKTTRCEKCGSELVTNNFSFCECLECGNTFINGLASWFYFWK